MVWQLEQAQYIIEYTRKPLCTHPILTVLSHFVNTPWTELWYDNNQWVGCPGLRGGLALAGEKAWRGIWSGAVVSIGHVVRWALVRRGGEPMQKARVNGHVVIAGPDAPKVALCPCCGWVVEIRKRRKPDGQVTYFWRHKVGGEDGCSLRYHPDEG